MAYLLLRYFTGNSKQTANFSAVLGIVGFLVVPLVYTSINWWSPEAQVHPQRVGLEPNMQVAFFVSLFTFTLLYLYLLIRRVQLSHAQEAVDQLRAEQD